MAISPTFQVGPPPTPGGMTRTNGQDVFVPNPQFYNWQRLFWQWSTTLGNNADGAATFSGSIAIGTSPNWFKADASGIWLGGATFAASPFSVSMAGAVKGTSGTIGGWSLGTTSLSSVSGGNTTTLSSGATALSAGPTGSPTTTITQAGALTTSNITVTGGTILVSGASSDGTYSGSIVASNNSSTVTAVVGHNQNAAGVGVSGIADTGLSALGGTYGVLSTAGAAGGIGGQFTAGPIGGYSIKLIGRSTTDSQIISTLATGTAPFSITSTTRVSNLNVATCGVADSASAVAVGGITGLGTGVSTALALNVGSAGAPVTFNGALGTPSSGTLTSCTFPTLNQNTTGSAASLTSASGSHTYIALGGVASGASTANTALLTTKPGSNSNGAWYQFTIDGNTVYMPGWS